MMRRSNSGGCIVFYLTHHGFPRVETNTHLRSDAVFGFEFRSFGFQSFWDRQCGATGPQWRIFECDRGSEYRHNTVAGEVLNDPDGRPPP
jgi:hypothetical protein